jgi:hypothetical protein
MVYLTLFPPALLYFDYALTFGMEVRYIWRQKFRFTTIMYYFCRYALVANIMYILNSTGYIHSEKVRSSIALLLSSFTDPSFAVRFLE